MKERDEASLLENFKSSLLLDIEKIFERQRDFSLFFQNIKQIVWMQNCIIMSDIQKNPAVETGEYPNQNILQFYYADKTINLDLNECCILDNKFIIKENTGIKTILFNNMISDEIDYNIEEIEKAIESINNKRGQLENLRFQRKTLSEESFKDLLEEKYNVVFYDEKTYIEENNYRLFLEVDLSLKIINFTGAASFFKNENWQKPINLDEKYISLEKTFLIEEEI